MLLREKFENLRKLQACIDESNCQPGRGPLMELEEGGTRRGELVGVGLRGVPSRTSPLSAPDALGPRRELDGLGNLEPGGFAERKHRDGRRAPDEAEDGARSRREQRKEWREHLPLLLSPGL